MTGDIYDGSTAQQRGDHNTQYNQFHSARRQRAACPYQVGVIPPRAGCFLDRAEAERLRQVLASGGTAVVGPTKSVLAGGVLAGLGGVGKTQLAAEYARTAWSTGELDVLVWVTAGTRSAVVARYAQAALDVLGIEAQDPEQATAAFLAWLEPKSEPQPCRWLVVLDDIADPANLDGLWPPASPHGRTLATTRRKDAALTGPGRRRIEVGEFTSVDAVDYLTAALAAHDRTEPADHVTALAGDLGCLPLALSQAAAYMIDTGKSCATYRSLLANRARTLADLSPDVLPDGQSHTMAAAWSLSVEYADQLRPAGLARPMLQLAAFLDPNGIPVSVLTSQPALSHLTNADRGPASTPAANADDADGALRALHRLSLLHDPPQTGNTDDSGGVVRVHQIVQRATRDTLPPEQYDRTARTAADALTDAWPDTERDSGLVQMLRASAITLTACAETALHQPDAHPVLFEVGDSLGNSGQVATAIAHYQLLADTTCSYHGPEHRSTLAALVNLERWRGQTGNPAEAVTVFNDLVDRMVRVLGFDDSHTLAARVMLAQFRRETGDAAGALAAFTDLMDRSKRLLGRNHPTTLMIRCNLAGCRGMTGDAAGAAEAIADLLDRMVRVLGPDHVETLTTRNNLAYFRGEAGDAAGAMAAYADLLTDRLRVLGPDHPNTLITRGNLAYWQGEAGDLARAVAAHADLLTDRLRVLGPDHPDTLTTRNNLARCRGVAGDAAGAVMAFADLLADRLRVLGPDNPHTLTTRSNLTYWREQVRTQVERANDSTCYKVPVTTQWETIAVNPLPSEVKIFRR